MSCMLIWHDTLCGQIIHSEAHGLEFYLVDKQGVLANSSLSEDGWLHGLQLHGPDGTGYWVLNGKAGTLSQYVYHLVGGS